MRNISLYMYLPQLEALGFTPREIRVYVSLLELGTCAVGKIITHSKIPSSKIYETLDKLKSKGLVSFIVKENKQFFTAISPLHITDILDEQRRGFMAEALPVLQSLEKKEKVERSATLYEGVGGLKSIYELMLRELGRGDTLYVLGAPRLAQEKLTAFLLEFNKRRIKKGIHMNILYHADAREHGKIREKMGLTSVKYLQEDFCVPALVDIFGEYVVLFNIDSSPTATLIKDRAIAQSFLAYFDAIWGSVRKY